MVKQNATLCDTIINGIGIRSSRRNKLGSCLVEDATARPSRKSEYPIIEDNQSCNVCIGKWTKFDDFSWVYVHLHRSNKICIINHSNL